MDTRQVIIEGLNVRYYTSESLNSDSALVFLHGWGSEALHLRNIFQNYPNYIAIDLPGFGKSEHPNNAWGISNYADFVGRFLVKLEIKNPTLVGHSVGGAIIIKYLASGGSAKKAVLISPSGIRKRGIKIYLYNFFAKLAKILLFLPILSGFRGAIRKSLYKSIGSEDYIEAGEMVESYKKIIRDDLRMDMKKIDARVTLIWGENDLATPLKQGEETQKLIKKSKLFVVKNAGHYSFIDQPRKFNEIFSVEINAD